MSKDREIVVKDTAPKNYTIIKDIKESYLYNSKGVNKDDSARKFIENNCEKVDKKNITPGQLILFKYLNPKNKEDLEYYDASPCTIFFGIFNSSLGKRVLGFNIHYYPPKMRYQIMNKIFKLYRPIYLKYFNSPNLKEIDAFDYKFLINELEKAKLTFGVREYIPKLMGNLKIIPTNVWKVAVFTEGWFKKATKAQIMRYWKEWKEKNVN